MKRTCWHLFVLLFVIGCAQVPKPIGRPWKRTLSAKEIIPGSSMSLSSECLSTPIIGSHSLEEGEVLGITSDLLERRGFIITDKNPRYKMKIVYQTDHDQKDVNSTSCYYDQMTGTYSTNNNSFGFGVQLAQSVYLIRAQSQKTTISTDYSTDRYTHYLACEIYTSDNELVWKNDTFVETGSVDILGALTPIVQIAFSDLPSTRLVVPHVRKLKRYRFDDFAKLFLNSRKFMCPALPNLISFQINDTRNQSNFETYVNNVTYPGISDPTAILAFIDLLETAEFAIPKGSKEDWADPTEASIWASAVLIGRYYLGNNTTPVNVVIELKGTSDQYLVESCRIVSDNEYASYQSMYDSWMETLSMYFQFYVDTED